MAPRLLFVAFSMVAATGPVSASIPDGTVISPAPAGTPTSRYCLKVEAPTGSRIEPVECWTREEWADQGVDVDHDWAKEGVAVIG